MESQITIYDVDCNPLSYAEFFTQHLVGNIPCLFRPSLTKAWRARRDWISKTDGSTLDVSLLSISFGSSEVPISDCDAQNSYSTTHKPTESFSSYLHYFSQKPEGRAGCRYLKDWHFQRCFPGYHAYDVPVYFSSDWLNEYCDGFFAEDPKGDYRFLYLGPQGSWTAFHEDVLKSFSWSANISGQKKWYMFPPGQEKRIVASDGHLADVRDADLSGCKYYEFTQMSGEIVFVPSGWHHQVHNMEDTLSINHNWINSANAEQLWNLLKSTLSLVGEEIGDCRSSFSDSSEWRSQCQMVLKGELGMDMDQFADMLLLITRNRYRFLAEISDSVHHFVWLEDLACLKRIFFDIGKADTDAYVSDDSFHRIEQCVRTLENSP